MVQIDPSVRYKLIPLIIYKYCRLKMITKFVVDYFCLGRNRGSRSEGKIREKKLSFVMIFSHQYIYLINDVNFRLKE